MAAEACFILIHRRRNYGRPIRSTDTFRIDLRRANRRRHRKSSQCLRCVCTVAVYTGGMTVVIEQHGFRCIMCVCPGRQQVANLVKFAEHIWGRRRDIRSAKMAGDAILRVDVNTRSCGRRRA